MDKALFDSCDLNSLRKGYYGAALMPVAALKEMAKRMAQIPLWNFYGQSGIAPLATVLKPEDQLRKSGSTGRPVLNVKTRVLDEVMNDEALGEIGEIVHRSPQFLTGYFNEEAKTAAVF